jgi:hypothetical protein
MASTVDLYIGPIKIGSGRASGGSASITSYSDDTAFTHTDSIQHSGLWKATIPRYTSGEAFSEHPHVTVHVTQAGTHVGRTWYTRVLSDNGAGTLTLVDACPFVGA